MSDLDEGQQALAGLSVTGLHSLTIQEQLRELDLCGCAQIDAAATRKLRRILPQCVILHGSDSDHAGAQGLV